MVVRGREVRATILPFHGPGSSRLLLTVERDGPCPEKVQAESCDLSPGVGNREGHGISRHRSGPHSGGKATAGGRHRVTDTVALHFSPGMPGRQKAER